MPYDLLRFSRGWRVCKRDDHDRCYSNKPLPLDNAKRQRIALYIHERRKHGGQIWMADPELHDKIRQQTEAELPTHSLYRSSLIHDRYHEALGGASSADKFAKQLDKIGLSPNSYLTQARMSASHHGYRPDLLSFAKDGDHKLKYQSPHGVRYFGKAGYGDYIIYEYLEHEKKVEPGYANKKRKVFRDSHERISEIRKLDKFSPNELAINILW
jgi:hypothetical protein